MIHGWYICLIFICSHWPCMLSDLRMKDRKPTNRKIRQQSIKSSLSATSAVECPISGRKNASHFSELMCSYKLPLPGPSYYEARRTLWLCPSDDVSTPPPPSFSQINLETLLSQEDVIKNDVVWKNGLKNVWMGLLGGNQVPDHSSNQSL